VCGKTAGAAEGVVSVSAGFNTQANTIKVAASTLIFMTLLRIVDYFWALLCDQTNNRLLSNTARP
jgi:hypothetical protein